MVEPSERKILNKEAAFRCPESWNAITRGVIACAMEVHSVLGPGLLERLYEDALDYELRKAGIRFSRQHPVVIAYKDIRLSGRRLDLVVEDLVVVELKSIDKVPDARLATLVSYMRSGQFPLGLLISFNVPHLRDGIYRRLNCEYPAVEPYLRRPGSGAFLPQSAPPSSSV